MRRGLIAIVLVAILGTSGCAPDPNIVVGTWVAADGAILEFFDDGTFTANRVSAGALYPDLVAPEEFGSDPVDGLGGTWAYPGLLDENFPGGYTVEITWDTPPVDWIKSSLWIHEVEDVWEIAFVESGYFRDETTSPPTVRYAFLRER